MLAAEEEEGETKGRRKGEGTGEGRGVRGQSCRETGVDELAFRVCRCSVLASRSAVKTRGEE